MQILTKTVAGLALAAALASTAQALPVQRDLSTGAMAPTLVSGGCGPYAHRTPWGNCRPNGWGWGHPGWHRGWGWHHWHHWHHW